MNDQAAVRWRDGVEVTCQRCGGNNPTWFVESDRFNMSVAALGLTSVAIICPGCFVEGHELASGMHCSWQLVPASLFRWIEREVAE